MKHWTLTSLQARANGFIEEKVTPNTHIDIRAT